MCINHAIATPRITQKTAICPKIRHFLGIRCLFVLFSANPLYLTGHNTFSFKDARRLK
jgi:hypothetical protein